MSVQAIPAPPAPGGPTPAWPLYRAMVGVGLVCGVLVVAVFQLTRPVIADNRAAALEAAIFEVFPGARRTVTFVRVADPADPDGRFAPVPTGSGAAAGADQVHAAYDASGRLVGIAVEAAGMGYQDTIRVLYGISPERHAIIGLQVLDSKETPGLGDRITSDAHFLANFEQLDVSLDGAADDPAATIANPIVVVSSGAKTSPWQIDGITGATISSKAIGEILRRSTASWVPVLERRAADFAAAPVGAGDPSEPPSGEASHD